MTIIIPYRKDTAYDGAELHYSIKGLRKFLPGRVITVGDTHPDADDNIPCKDVVHKQKSIVNKITAACLSGIVTDPFICMSDDIYLLRPWVHGYYHKGLLAHHKPTGIYARFASYTMRLGCTHDFDNHCPIVYEKQKFIDRVTKPFETGHDYMIQSLYCKDEPGTFMEDVKINRLMTHHEILARIAGHARFSTGPGGITPMMRKVWEGLYP